MLGWRLCRDKPLLWAGCGGRADRVSSSSRSVCPSPSSVSGNRASPKSDWLALGSWFLHGGQRIGTIMHVIMQKQQSCDADVFNPQTGTCMVALGKRWLLPGEVAGRGWHAAVPDDGPLWLLNPSSACLWACFRIAFHSPHILILHPLAGHGRGCGGLSCAYMAS